MTTRRDALKVIAAAPLLGMVPLPSRAMSDEELPDHAIAEWVERYAKRGIIHPPKKTVVGSRIGEIDLKNHVDNCPGLTHLKLPMNKETL